MTDLLNHYSAETAPDPAQWLALDEGERILLIEEYHKARRVELPDIQIHALVHTVVENQLAMNHEPVVRTMKRLRLSGLSRHDAVHAIGCLVAEYLFGMVSKSASDSSDEAMTRYNAALERLTAKSWRRQYGS